MERPTWPCFHACILALSIALLPGSASAQIEADFTANPTSGTNPLIVTLADASTGDTPISWNWNFGDGSFGVGPNAMHVYSTPGTYTVSFTVFGKGGGLDTEVKTDLISVASLPVTPGFVTSSTLGATPLVVSFTNTTVGPVADWRWDFGDGSSSVEKHPTRNYGQPGTYTVTLTAINGGQQDSITKADLIHVKPQFMSQQQLGLGFNGVADVVAGDVDGDGDLDVLSVARLAGIVVWYANLDGLGSFGPAQIIDADAFGAGSIAVADLDGDLDLDVVVGMSTTGVFWYENTDGAGGFGTQQTVSTELGGIQSIDVADLDGDQAPDVVVASQNQRVAWWSNQLAGTGDWGAQQVLSMTSVNPQSVQAADLDGDLDMDVVYASWYDSTVAWFENTDGQGAFGSARIVTALSIKGTNAVHAADLDGDLDLDLLVSEYSADSIVWFRNTDGQGHFGSGLLIASDVDLPDRVFAADLDGDGDQDALALAGSMDGLLWFENLNGLGSFGPGFLIEEGSFAAGQFFGLHAADLDDDGDPDVLMSGHNSYQTRWFQNVQGAPFWTNHGGAATGAEGLPALRATGSLMPGTPLTLELHGTPPNTLMLAWLSFTATPINILGGVLYTIPPNVQLLQVSDTEGAWSQSISWPAGIPPNTDFWLQFIVADATTPDGLTLSNAVSATTP